MSLLRKRNDEQLVDNYRTILNEHYKNNYLIMINDKGALKTLVFYVTNYH